jgi:hypothetical protein
MSRRRIPSQLTLPAPTAQAKVTSR